MPLFLCSSPFSTNCPGIRPTHPLVITFPSVRAMRNHGLQGHLFRQSSNYDRHFRVSVLPSNLSLPLKVIAFYDVHLVAWSVFHAVHREGIWELVTTTFLYRLTGRINLPRSQLRTRSASSESCRITRPFFVTALANG